MQRCQSGTWNRLAGLGWWAGSPSLGWCTATGRAVGSVLVVVVPPGVELVLQVGVTAGGGQSGQPSFGRLVGPFELAAGLGMSRARAQVLDAHGAQLTFEVNLAALEPTGEAQAVVAHHSGR